VKNQKRPAGVNLRTPCTRGGGVYFGKIKKQKPDFENGWAASLRSGFLFSRHRRSKNTMKYSVFFWNDKITRIFTKIQRNPIRFRLYFCIYLCISVNIRKNPSFFWIFECKRENPTVFTEILDRIYIYIYIIWCTILCEQPRMYIFLGGRHHACHSGYR